MTGYSYLEVAAEEMLLRALRKQLTADVEKLHRARDVHRRVLADPTLPKNIHAETHRRFRLLRHILDHLAAANEDTQRLIDSGRDST